MAAVYPHKSRGYQVRYYLYLPDGSRVTKYRYYQSSVEAEQVRRDCDFIEKGSRAGNLSTREIAQARRDGLINDDEARVLSGGAVVVDYDLDRVVEEYRKTISVSHTPEAFGKAYAKVLLLADWLKRRPIPTLTDADVKEYILARREGNLVFRNAKTGFARVGVSPKTIKNELNLLQGLIDEAVKLRMVDRNAARAVTVPVKTKKVQRALAKAQIDKVVETARRHSRLMHGQILDFVMIALYTGFRRSELRTLTWDDVDLINRRITVQSKPVPDEPDFTPKSGSARSKSIPDKLMPVLQSMDRRGRFLFGGERPYHKDSISQVLRLVMKRAGLVGFSLHNCRHTYGSWLLRKTGDLKYVQDEMGHLDISTTKNYMHSIESDDPAKSFDYE